MVDNFSKHVILGATPNRQAQTIAEWFYTHVICLFGAPEIIKSDGGSEFKGMFEGMCNALKIRHHTTLPYHPQSNGIAERFVRTVKAYLLKYLISAGDIAWDQLLCQVQYVINTTVATSHGFTPF